MGLAHDLERRLERLVDGAAAAVFRGRMHPVDMANRLVRQVDFLQTQGPAGIEIPNRLLIRMNPVEVDDDLDRAQLGRELANAVAVTAAERGWKINGPISVEVTTDPTVPRGLIDCEGTSAPGPIEAWAQLLAIDTALALPVTDNRNLIGRALDNDVVLPVPEVSRHHALLVREVGTVRLADLGSANGTSCNGVAVGSRPAHVTPGDTISFGDVAFRFRTV